MSVLLSQLTPPQLQALYDQSGFWLIKDLPKGSLVGIDGSLSQILKFSGFKLIPPSLHLVTLSPPTHSNEAIPAPRTGTLFFSKPHQIISREWSTSLDSSCTPPSIEPIVSKGVLKSLDSQLAPFPFDDWETWKGLFPPELADRHRVGMILGKDARDGCWDLDGFTLSSLEDEEGDSKEVSLGDERVMRHRAETKGKDSLYGCKTAGGQATEGVARWARFDLRISWRKGAVGEETSLFARDKSWLFWEVVNSQCAGDLTLLLTQLALLLPLALQLQVPFLFCSIYRRILSLLTTSHIHLLPTSSQYLSHPPPYVLPSFYYQFLSLVTAQLRWLPQGFFVEELPEAEDWFRRAILEDMQAGLRARFEAGLWTEGEEKVWCEVRNVWMSLSALCEDKFGWTLDTTGRDLDEEEEEEEDEEDRPVVVDL